MKKALFIFLIMPVASLIYAQNISGEYYLKGVMETASGFKLNADSSFQFFFSYGALDRYGKGKWHLENDSTIIFNSEKRPPLDFKIINSERNNDGFISIKIDNENTGLLRYVMGFIKTKSGNFPFEMDEDGMAKVKILQADSINLIFSLCPDRYSVFPVGSNDNSFEFEFEPWIADVFFENFQLSYTANSLTGKHPLLDGAVYTYQKE